jgi:hypothetical protein
MKCDFFYTVRYVPKLGASCFLDYYIPKANATESSIAYKIARHDIPSSQYLSFYNITVGGTAVNFVGMFEFVGSQSENISYYITKCEA